MERFLNYKMFQKHEIIGSIYTSGILSENHHKTITPSKWTIKVFFEIIGLKILPILHVPNWSPNKTYLLSLNAQKCCLFDRKWGRNSQFDPADLTMMAEGGKKGDNKIPQLTEKLQPKCRGIHLWQSTQGRSVNSPATIKIGAKLGRRSFSNVWFIYSFHDLSNNWYYCCQENGLM